MKKVIFGKKLANFSDNFVFRLTWERVCDIIFVEKSIIKRCVMLSLSVPVLLVISVSFSVLSSISRAFFTKKVSSFGADIDAYNLVLNITCALVVLFVSGGSFDFSVYSVLMGVAFGALCFFQMKTNLKALGMGPFSYTTVIVSLSAIIPTLSGLFFGEKIDLFQYIGIALMVACILLSNEKKSGEEKKGSALWLVLCLLSSLFNGFIGVFQKIHQKSGHKDEVTVFLLSAFIVASVCSLVYLLYERRDASVRERQRTIFFKWYAVVPIVDGIALGCCHVVNLFLSGRMESAVMFPVVNLVPFAISAIAATLIFKEKLSRRRFIGILVGVLATVFVAGVFSSWLGM